MASNNNNGSKPFDIQNDSLLESKQADLMSSNSHEPPLAFHNDKAPKEFEHNRSKSISYMVQSLDISGTKTAFLDINSSLKSAEQPLQSTFSQQNVPHELQLPLEEPDSLLNLMPIDKSLNSLFQLHSSTPKSFDFNQLTPDITQTSALADAHIDDKLNASAFDEMGPLPFEFPAFKKTHKRSHSTPAGSLDFNLTFQMQSANYSVHSPHSGVSETGASFLQSIESPSIRISPLSTGHKTPNPFLIDVNSLGLLEKSFPAHEMQQEEANSSPSGPSKSLPRRLSVAFMEGLADTDLSASNYSNRLTESSLFFSGKFKQFINDKPPQTTTIASATRPANLFVQGAASAYNNGATAGGVSKRTSWENASSKGFFAPSVLQKRHSVAAAAPSLYIQSQNVPKVGFLQNASDSMFSSVNAAPTVPGGSFLGTGAPFDMHLLANGTQCPFTPATNPVNPTKSGRNPYRRRARASDQQLRILSTAFNMCAIPDTKARRNIARQCGMTERSVQIWFQNRRAKQKLASNAQDTQNQLSNIHNVLSTMPNISHISGPRPHPNQVHNHVSDILNSFGDLAN